jgi:hypothetical protein
MSVATTPTRHDPYCSITIPWIAECDCGVAAAEQEERDRFDPSKHKKGCQRFKKGGSCACNKVV